MPQNADFGVHSDVIRAFQTTIYDEPGLGPRPNGRVARRLWKFKRLLNIGVAGAARSLSKASANLSDDAQMRAQDWDFATSSHKWPGLRAALNAMTTRNVAHIVAPSSDVELICGLVQLRDELPHLNNAHIHARLISLTPNLSRLRADASATRPYAELMATRMTNVHLYVETPAMQTCLTDAFGLASSIYPYLLAPPPFELRTNLALARFGYFGGMRNEKGFSRLLPMIEEVGRSQLASDPALAFTIHASDAKGAQAASLKAAFAAIATPRMTIDFIAGPLNEVEYLQRFREIDGAILPYTGARYALSGSGIVCEALAMGKVILMSEGLSFGGQCDASHAIEAGNVADFAQAILMVCRNLQRYRIAASVRATRYVQDATNCALLQRLNATQ